MAKKPFAIRVESHDINRFKALHTVLNVDGAKVLSLMIAKMEDDLSPQQKETYTALLLLWRES